MNVFSRIFTPFNLENPALLSAVAFALGGLLFLLGIFLSQGRYMVLVLLASFWISGFWLSSRLTRLQQLNIVSVKSLPKSQVTATITSLSALVLWPAFSAGTPMDDGLLQIRLTPTTRYAELFNQFLSLLEADPILRSVLLFCVFGVLLAALLLLARGRGYKCVVISATGFAAGGLIHGLAVWNFHQMTAQGQEIPPAMMMLLFLLAYIVSFVLGGLLFGLAMKGQAKEY